MQLGIILPQTEIGPDPTHVAAFARAAEAVGFTYLMAYDHVLGADSASRPGWDGFYDHADQFHEPFVLFGWLAAHTRMELVTGVLVLPQRQTALVAKQAAQVDLLSGGRLRLGVGVGWNQVEYEALGVPFHERGRRYEEQVELLRLLWTRDVVDFDGRFHRVDRAGILPRPVQRPIPIWMGTRLGEAVLRRVGRVADGWIANRRVGDGFAEGLAVVRASAQEHGRTVGVQALVDVRVGRDEVRRQLDALVALGASHVSLSPLGQGLTPEEHVDALASLAEVVEAYGDGPPTP